MAAVEGGGLSTFGCRAAAQLGYLVERVRSLL